MFDNLFNYIESLVTKNLSYFTMVNSDGDSLSCTIFKKSHFCDIMCAKYDLPNSYDGEFRYDFEKEYLNEIIQQITSDCPSYMTLVRYVSEFTKEEDIENLDETYYHEIISFIIYPDGKFKRLNLDYIKSLDEEEISLYSDFAVFIGEEDTEALPVCYLR